MRLGGGWAAAGPAAAAVARAVVAAAVAGALVAAPRGATACRRRVAWRVCAACVVLSGAFRAAWRRCTAQPHAPWLLLRPRSAVRAPAAHPPSLHSRRSVLVTRCRARFYALCVRGIPRLRVRRRVQLRGCPRVVVVLVSVWGAQLGGCALGGRGRLTVARTGSKLAGWRWPLRGLDASEGAVVRLQLESWFIKKRRAVRRAIGLARGMPQCCTRQRATRAFARRGRAWRRTHVQCTMVGRYL